MADSTGFGLKDLEYLVNGEYASGSSSTSSPLGVLNRPLSQIDANVRLLASILAVQHKSDGNLKDLSVAASMLKDGAVTDAKFSGVLPVNKGGTGTTDGFNFANFIDFTVLANKIGFKIGRTVEDFCLRLPNNCAFVTLIQARYFSDNDIFDGILRISKYDRHSIWLYLDGVPLFGNDWKQSVGTMQTNKFSGWKLLRNTDGSIPAELINLPVGFSYIQTNGTGTPDTVFGTAGKWQEITSTATGFPAGTRIWKKRS